MLQDHTDLFNNIYLFIHHISLTPDKIENGAIFMLVSALHLYTHTQKKNQFLCLTPTAGIVKVFIFQMVSQSS